MTRAAGRQGGRQPASFSHAGVAPASAIPVSWVVPGRAFVAVLVVAGQSGHKLLRIAVCDVGKELPGGGAAQGRRMTAAMTDDDVAADHLVLEAGGWVGHGIQSGWRAGRA